MLSIIFTPHPILVPPLELPSREMGACVEFYGIVRELENGAPLQGLHYEAYESMATRQLERIFNELQTTAQCGASITFIHRLGWVPVEEASMFVRVLTSHRAAAFAICAEAIDRMKQDVPIWKRSPRS